MSRRLLFSLVLIACLAFVTCSEELNPPGGGGPPELTEAQQRLVESDNRFGIKLFKEILRSEGREKNVFISPLSVSMALGMTFNGASGSTEEAMREVLELGDLTLQEVNESYKDLLALLMGLDPTVEFAIANSIWYRDRVTFKDEFIDLNKTYFDAQVTGLDFDRPDAAGIINKWVADNTQGKIREIVDDPIEAYMIMFLINAIYFKGTWTYEFDPAKTEDDLFTLPDGSKSPCRMMNQETEFRYQTTAHFQAVDLPYGDGDFSMVVLLPAEGVEIDTLVAMMGQKSWEEWLAGFSGEEILLQFPKFSMEYDIGLKGVLAALGMGIAFDEYEADFKRMYEGFGNVFLSSVKHKTFVKVDEKGTEAAGATSVGVGVTSLPPTMRVDRPFLFVIRESHSHTILFIGKIVEPTWE